MNKKLKNICDIMSILTMYVCDEKPEYSQIVSFIATTCNISYDDAKEVISHMDTLESAIKNAFDI